MTDEEIKRIIVQAVANSADIDTEDVSAEHDLIQDLNMDSLSVYEIVVDLEAAFDMQISDEDVERLHTVDDIANYVANRMKK